MNFEHAHPLAFCVFSTIIWITISAAVLWPFSWSRLIDRLPFILTVANYFGGFAVMILPHALPGPFESLLGHSIYAKRFDTDWQWVNRWEFVVAPVWRWGFELGAIVGLLNLVRKLDLSDRIFNVLAVAVGVALYYISTFVGI
jgi:hypothetical protein